MFSSPLRTMCWFFFLPLACMVFIMLSITTVKLIISILSLSKAFNLTTIYDLLPLAFASTYSIGAVIGMGIGCVFLLIAAFAFTDACIATEVATEKMILLFCKWVSVSTSLLLLLTLAGWYLCTTPQLQKKGMIFSHPKVIGEIYRYVEEGPIFYAGYNSKEVKEFKTRVAYISKGIFKEARNNCDSSTLLSDIAGMPFFIALGFSLVGAVIWALIDILERLKDTEEQRTDAEDNKPKKGKIKNFLPRHYLSYILRCVTAPFVAMVIAFFVAGNWPANSAPALFFFIGLFPKRGIQFIGKIGTQLTTLNEAKQANNQQQVEEKEENEAKKDNP